MPDVDASAPMGGPMRIVFVSPDSSSVESGVTKKIRGQVRAWRDEGHEVVLVEPGNRSMRGMRLVPTLSAMLRQAASLGPDVVYVRHTTWVPRLSRVARRHTLVLELNGDDVRELRVRRVPFRLYHRLVRRLALRAAALVIVPSKELERRRYIGAVARRTAVVSNGIDLAAVRELPAPHNDRLRVGFTFTSPGDWTGLDQVLELAADLPELAFDVIGPATGLRGPDNVTFHGYLDGDLYEGVVAGLDAGLGSLALHRAGLSEASTLKVRGYLAHGIPAIIGHHDTDFPDPVPFVLEIPNADGAARRAAEEIRSFVLRHAGRRVPRKAIQHLDARSKERARLAHIDAVRRR